MCHKSVADDLVSSCLAAEKRCATHPYGSKAGTLLLFELSRSVQAKVLAARDKADTSAKEVQKLREFKGCWESSFGLIRQGELGVLPMTPEAALAYMRKQDAEIEALERDLERERKANDESVFELQSTLKAHQESSRRAQKFELDRMARQFEVGYACVRSPGRLRY